MDSQKNRVIKFSCSDSNYSQLIEFAISLGISVNKEKGVKFIDCDELIDLISEHIEFPGSRENAETLQPLELLREIEIKSDKKLDPKKFGAAMKNLGFAKQCVRIDGVPKHVYLIKWK
jgi:hypothetical protein